MYQNILVPLAFDDEHDPEKALEVTRALSAPGAKITLVHVLPDIPTYAASYVPADYSEELRKTMQDKLDAVATGFGDAKTVVCAGNPANEILALAEELKADCIVIASHRPGFGDFLIGSNAARVVRHATCSVMVLR